MAVGGSAEMPVVMVQALSARPDLLMALTDREGQIEWVNQTFAERTGLPTEDLAGKVFFKALMPCAVGGEQQAYIQERLYQGAAFKVELTCLSCEQSEFWLLVDAQPIRDERGEVCRYSLLATDITTRKQMEQAFDRTRQRLKRLVESVQMVPWEAEVATHRFTYVGPRAAELLDYDLATWYGSNFWLDHVHPEDLPTIPYHDPAKLLDQDDYVVEYRLRSGDGRWVWVKDIVTVLRQGDKPAQLIGFLLEITDRKRAELAIHEAKVKLEEANEVLELRVQQRTAALQQEKEKSEQALRDLQTIQTQLIQAEKMSSLGQMIAGIAHEINNPVGSLVGNLKPAETYIQDLFRLLREYHRHYPDPDQAIARLIEEVELDFVQEDLPKLLRSMKEAVSRIQSISYSMKTFVRSDTCDKVEFEVHEGLNSTLMLLQNRLKAQSDRPAIEIVKQYGEVPAIYCFPGQLNQVFMNLMVNAIDALEESNQGLTYAEIAKRPNQISLATSLLDASAVVISIRDNGPGIPEEVQQRLFDYMFTTKPVGYGTGLGLSISRQIVEEKHGGKLSFLSAVGKGTEFIIQLPLG